MVNTKNAFYSGLFDWAQALVSAIVFIVLLFAFVVCQYMVENVSMQSTLYAGDRLIVSDLFYTPQRGDIVMFNKAGTEFLLDLSSGGPQPPLVKRVIAVGGDTLDIDYAAGTLSINGEVVQEPYVRESMLVRGDTAYPFMIPEGYVFCMGDNRNNSIDSRDSRIGLIDQRYILGRVLLRVFPIDKFGPVD